jgi:hypothetical protein
MTAASSPGDAWRLLLIGLAGVLAAALLLAPASKGRTSKR